MLRNPYVCGNPSTQCAAAPSLNAWNRELGCLLLQTAGEEGECLPSACPTLPCGDQACLPPCPDNVALSDCPAYYAKLGSGSTGYVATDCNVYLAGNAKKMVAEVPMEGCTGACWNPGTTTWDMPASGKAGCCTVPATGNSESNPVYKVDFDADASTSRHFQLPMPKDANGGDMQGATVVSLYEDYLNIIYNCAKTSCSCPTRNGSECSGHGACQAQTSGEYVCVCANKYTGPDCGDAPSSNKACPTSWNNAQGRNVTCTSAVNGTCDESTKTCTCAAGWSGDACDVQVCPVIEGKQCAGNGTCVALTGVCVCESGFHGTGCNCTTDAAGKETCVGSSSGSTNTSTKNTGSVNVNGETVDTGATAADAAASKLKSYIIGGSIGFVVLILVVVGIFFIVKHARAKTKKGTSRELTIATKILHAASKHPAPTTASTIKHK